MANAIPFEPNQFTNIEHESIKQKSADSDTPVSKKNFEICLRIGNGLMLVSLIAFIVAILIGYQFQNYVSMPVEIAAHIASMVLPGFFKIGYVLRCIGRKHLGKEV